MGKQIITASRKYLGDSVIVYELGNEVCATNTVVTVHVTVPALQEQR
jgi:hypothetical protein